MTAQPIIEEIRLPVVQALPLGCVIPRWDDHYKYVVEIALEKSYRAEDTAEEVMRQLMNGQATLVQIAIGDVETGVCIVDTVRAKDGPWLNIWTLTGRGMDTWLEDLQDFLADWAQLLGYKGIMCGGRLGWEKELGALGWRREAVIMQKEVGQ